MIMSDQTKNPHDARLKELFKNKTAFVSLLKDCVKADWIDSLDIDSLKRSETSFILHDFRNKEADIIYEATIDNGSRKVIFYLLLELQSYVDYRMPYRLLLYIVEILRQYYNDADTKLRKRKGFKFPAVVPVVFFCGSRKWTAPTSLREMFDGRERFGDSLLNFDYALVDVKGFDDESVKGFHSKLLKVMMMFEQSENMNELFEVIHKYSGDIEEFDDDELRVISAAISILSNLYGAGESKELSEALDTKGAERVSGMLSSLIAREKRRERLIRQSEREQGIERGIEQGFERGFEQEKYETARVLLEMGLSVEQVAKGTRLPIEEVERIKGEASSSSSV